VKVYSLEREQSVPASLPRVFAFFSDAANLEAITPPWLGFRIRTPLPIEMREGARIEYTLRLGGIPVRWRTAITRWTPPAGGRADFVDVQESGPYALWEHTHEFEVRDGSVRMTDRVRYALPLGPLGRAAHALLVRALLVRIFEHRSQRVRELFLAGGAS
jgi:ligand-binding SRPBCC domain-containing protein